jgi:Domain of Unknown Function (DUF1080)
MDCSRLIGQAMLGLALLGAIGCGSASRRGSPWTVLFDGSSVAAFRAYQGTDFPSQHWQVDAGALKTIPGPAIDLITRDTFEHFELELEWKVAPGGNSGIIYQVAETEPAPWHTGPEMQVLDDALHPDGKNPKTTAGSLYALIAPGENKKLRAVGEYNQARIRMEHGHVEHWLNGRKILEYEWGSPEVKALIGRSKFRDLPRFMRVTQGHIVLQHHEDEVWFRQIRVRRL